MTLLVICDFATVPTSAGEDARLWDNSMALDWNPRRCVLIILALAAISAASNVQSASAQSSGAASTSSGGLKVDPTFVFPFERRIRNWPAFPPSVPHNAVAVTLDGGVPVAIIRLPAVEDTAPYIAIPSEPTAA